MSREAAPTQKSLLSLPLELRDIIWSFVLGGRTFDVQCEVQIPWGTTTASVIVEKNDLSLLQTCRQIYSETRLLPFKLNTFRFKSEDVFKPWLKKFDVVQQGAMTEVHLVTWKAKHMIERRGFAARRLVEVFPIDTFVGLRKVHVEVRFTGVIRDCDKWSCTGSELEDTDWVEEEDKLRAYWTRDNPRLVVNFHRTAV